ncbi:TolC family protein [Candidatus Auribacterota bacterium]
MKTKLIITSLLSCLILGVLAIETKAEIIEKLTLNQAIETVLNNNLEMDIVELNKELCEENLAIQKRKKLPRVEGYLGYSSDRFSSESIEKGGVATLKITQPLWNGGKSSYEKKINKNLINSASVQIFKKQLDLTLAVKKAYFEIFAASEILKIRGEAKNFLNNYYKNIKELCEQRTISREEVVKTKTKINKTDLKLLETKNKLDIAKNELNYLLGSDKENYVVEHIFEENFYTVEELLQTALTLNPKILLHQQVKKNAKLQIAIAKAETYPEVDLYAQVSKRATFNNSLERSAGISFRLNIWGLSEAKSKLKKAKINYKKIVKEEELLKKRLKRDIKAALLDYDMAFKRVTATHAFLESAKEELEIALLKFKAGKTKRPQVIKAQVAYFDTACNLKRAYADCSYKKAVLARIVGVKNLDKLRTEFDYKFKELPDTRDGLVEGRSIIDEYIENPFGFSKAERLEDPQEKIAEPETIKKIVEKKLKAPEPKEPAIPTIKDLGDLIEYATSPEKLAHYLKFRIRYNPSDTDNIWQSAEETIQKGTGDCEDYAILAHEVLKALGFTPHILSVLPESKKKAGHVICTFKWKDYWWYFDNHKLKKTTFKTFKDIPSIIRKNWRKWYLVSPKRKLLARHTKF